MIVQTVLGAICALAAGKLARKLAPLHQAQRSAAPVETVRAPDRADPY
jgi:hypothetical protein